MAPENDAPTREDFEKNLKDPINELSESIKDIFKSGTATDKESRQHLRDLLEVMQGFEQSEIQGDSEAMNSFGKMRDDIEKLLKKKMDPETNHILKDMLESTEERAVDQLGFNEKVLSSISGVWDSTKKLTKSVLVDFPKELVSKFGFDEILQSQLGPLTPIFLMMSSRLKSIGESVGGWLKKIFKEKIWESGLIKKWRTWVRRTTRWFAKKMFSGIAGLLLFLPILLASFLKHGPIAMAKAIGFVFKNILLKRIAKWPGISKIVAGVKRFGSLFKMMDKWSPDQKLAKFTKQFGKLGKPILKIFDFFKRISGIVKSIKGSSVVEKAVSGIKRIFKLFKTIKGLIMKLPLAQLAGSFGKTLGRIFWPITILMSVFDFVEGFRSKQGEGILEQVKAGVMGVIEGIIKFPIWALSKLLGFIGLGFDPKAATDGILDIIGGIFDYVMIPFKVLWSAVKSIVDSVTSVFEKFGEGDILGGIGDLALLIPKMVGNMVSTMLDAVGEVFNIDNLWLKTKKWIWDTAGKAGQFLMTKVGLGSFGEAGAELEKIQSEKETQDKLSGTVVVKNLPPGEVSGNIGAKQDLPPGEVVGNIGAKNGLINNNTAVITNVNEIQPSAALGAIVEKGGITYVHSGELIVPKEVLSVISRPEFTKTSSKTDKELTNNVQKLTDKLHSVVDKTGAEEPLEKATPKSPQLLVGLDNIPMIIEDTGLILVSSGVL